MDTKSKKWKAIVSFAAFFLSINLLLAGLGTAFLSLTGSWYSVDYLADAFQPDYQNTSRFRDLVSGGFHDFLAMAAGGPLYSDGSSTITTETLSPGGWGWIGGVATESDNSEEEWRQQLREWNNQLRDPNLSENRRQEINAKIAAGPLGNGTASKTPEQLQEEYQKQADAAQAHYQSDRNLLYSISYDGKPKYANVEQTPDELWSLPPQGYNFLLRFDGQKVTIQKDGQELNVYGDGIYREDGSQWCLPGYQNYTVDAATQPTRLTLAVAKDPLLYIYGNFSGKSGPEQFSQIYSLQQEFQSARMAVYETLIILAAGLLLLVPYLLLHKHKRRANEWFARGTGRLPFELKLLLALLGAAACVMGFQYPYGGYLIQRWETVAYPMQSLFPLGALFYPGFWLCWLGANDLRHNKKPWRRGLVSGLLARELRTPLQKRMVRRCYVSILFLVALAAVFLAIAFGSGVNRDDISRLIWLLLLIALAAVLLLGLIAGRTRALARDLGRLSDQIEAVRNGGLVEPLILSAKSDLRETADSLNDIQRGMQTAFEDQTKSQRMKVELLTNVSHDIKTPLTSIISYSDLLLKEEELPEHIRDYARVLAEKAERLRTMVQDVFEVSKAASGNLPVNPEALDLGKLLRQTLADMGERIDESPVTVRAEIPESPVMIQADGQRLYRVFQNLLQNALQYSLEGSRVYVTLRPDAQAAVVRVKNTSRSELPPGVDFTERFKRGDESRTDGGSGLGLSIALSFTEACGGRFSVETDADLFAVTVTFPLLGS